MDDIPIGFEWAYLFPDVPNPSSGRPIFNSYITDKKSALGAVCGVLNDPEVFLDEPLPTRGKSLEARRMEMFWEMMRIEDKLGLKVALCNQGHTNTVCTVNESNINSFAPLAGSGGDTLLVCDGLITNLNGVMLCSRAMDCVHLAVKHIYSDYIGVVHSGWRGSLFGVNEALIRLMLLNDCPLDEIKVFVGPSISANNYEVGEDLYNMFTQQDQKYKSYFFRNKGRLFFDNRAFVIDKYIGADEIVNCGIDVFSSSLFASHRREMKDPSRLTAFAGNIQFIYN